MGAFAALKSDGSVVTWGDASYGGDSSGVANQMRSGVTQIFSTENAFAALKSDGSVVTWGDSTYGGDSSGVASQMRSGVTQIFSSRFVFAALKIDGSVVTWGYSGHGGDSSGLLRSGVTKIYSTVSALAALKSDGSVLTWGFSGSGGDSSGVASQLRSGITQIFSADSAFAALKANGSVVTWGSSSIGGDTSAVAAHLASGVTQIFSARRAFAALKSDGSVVTWGDASYGGDSSAVAARLASGVTKIFSTGQAFAALKSDGSVVTWGFSGYGGDSSGVAEPQLRSGVSQIFSSEAAFAALKIDGSVITWGLSSSGGDSSGVASQLRSGVIQIFSTENAFAALKSDGSVVTWGESSWGGDSSGVASQLRSGVEQIFSTRTAFAALKSDGSVVTWGESSQGGDSTGVASQLRSGVVAFANPFTDDRLVADQPLPVGSTYAIERLNQANLNSDGNEGSRHTFRIKRSGNTALAGSVRFSTSNGTATSGVDFLPFSRDIQFLAGEDKKDVYVDSRKDSLNEGTERFNVAITKINARDTIAKASTYGEIFNLLPASTYSIERRSSDGKEGYRHTFLIKREGDLSRPGQVRVSTSSNSATSGVDFNSYSAVRNFAINQDEQIVYVDSRNDSLKEGTERFNISLSIVRSQDKLNVATTFGQIFDVPPPLIYSIETLNTVDRKSDGLEGSRHYFRVKRSGNTAVSGSIRFFTSSGSAISNNDFLPYSTTIVFRPGEIEKYVYVDSIVDSLNEGAENLRASISKTSPQDILGSSSVVGVIRNRIINYNGVDKDGKSFTMLADSNTGLRHSRPSWSVQFDLKGSRIDPSLPTYVYVHGWKDKSTSKNSRLISSALGSERANVVLVDWSQMASVDSPLQPSLAVTVTRQVGESVADFLIKSGISPAMTTIVGHSLGSFVSASAALDVKNRTGRKIKELVALDNAYGLFYDIDARNYTYDKPLDFPNDLAVVTSSYTASDLVLFVKDWAGDNQRAATAQNAYIVQYARSSNLPNPLNPALQANAFHSGVIGVYADLFVKKALHPRVQNKFDASGKPATDGQFDGVIVAPMPWAYYGGNPVVAAPKAIGWTDSYDDPMIYGSASSDILFFDKFSGNHNGSSLNGLAGNDWIIADQTDGDGIDVLTGGLGTDTFWLGYERYGRKRESYTNPEKNSRGPDSAYALISDFKPSEDYIRLPLAKSFYSFVAASALPQFVSKTHGNGTGILSNGDLVAYVSGLSVPVFTNLIDKRVTFSYHAPLDSQLFA